MLTHLILRQMLVDLVEDVLQAHLFKQVELVTHLLLVLHKETLVEIMHLIVLIIWEVVAVELVV